MSSGSSSFQRAHHSEQKEMRRQSILDAASRRLEQDPLPEISIASVASEAGLAKGSVYRYFATREEIFLSLLQGELGRWLDALDAWLGVLSEPQPARVVASHMVESLRHEETLLRLLARHSLQLEENLSEKAALEFKRWLLGRVGRSGVLLERALGVGDVGLTRAASEGQVGARQLLRFSALCAGLWPMANPTGAVARVLTMEEMAPVRVDFCEELLVCAEALFVSAQEGARVAKNTNTSFPWSI